MTVSFFFFFFFFHNIFHNLFICIVQTILSSRFTGGNIKSNQNQIANHVWNDIPDKHRSTLKELEKNQTSVAHPDVSSSDLHQFIDKFNPDPIFLLTLNELELMEIWRDGEKECLFAD